MKTSRLKGNKVPQPHRPPAKEEGAFFFFKSATQTGFCSSLSHPNASNSVQHWMGRYVELAVRGFLEKTRGNVPDRLQPDTMPPNRTGLNQASRPSF